MQILVVARDRLGFARQRFGQRLGLMVTDGDGQLSGAQIDAPRAAGAVR